MTNGEPCRSSEPLHGEEQSIIDHAERSVYDDPGDFNDPGDFEDYDNYFDDEG